MFRQALEASCVRGRSTPDLLYKQLYSPKAITTGHQAKLNKSAMGGHTKIKAKQTTKADFKLLNSARLRRSVIAAATRPNKVALRLFDA